MLNKGNILVSNSPCKCYRVLYVAFYLPGWLILQDMLMAALIL